MNKIPLNIAGLDGGVIIKKGGGGGVTINNQEKSVDITENGVTEVTADSGFTGLSKVIVNTNVQSGGGGGSDMPVIGDGKTYLYITIAAEGRMDVPLYFQQSVANGVTIDWGDGSAPQTLGGTGNRNTTHKYAAIGDYVISLNPVDGCTLGLGHNSSSYCVMGSTGNNENKAYCNMLKMAEIGKGATSINSYAFDVCTSLASVVIPEGVKSIGNHAFRSCTSLASVTIPEGVTTIGEYSFSDCYSLASIAIPSSVTSIGNYAFRSCTSLASVTIPEGVTTIGKQAFYNCYALSSIVMPNSVTSTGIEVLFGCYALSSIVIPSGITSIANSFFDSCSSLSSVVIPEGVTTIGEYSFSRCYSLASIAIPSSVTSIGAFAFSGCFGMAFCDFSQHKAVPASGMMAFNNVSNFKIIVPDALYDEWKAATNWSTYASYIIKKSDWDASQS